MRTAIFHSHKALGAKMIDFCDWEMPLYYTSLIQEHLNVRQKGGIFDVSHMGRVEVEGKDAEKFLNYLSCNEIANKSSGTATYTIFCSEKGTCVEDLIIYKETDYKYFLILNACNRQKDLIHLQHFAHKYNYAVEIRDRYQENGILAIQGPKALILLLQFFPDLKNLSPMHFLSTHYENENIFISRTGYTGENGYEIYASNPLIVTLWNQLIKEGKILGIEPAGLGARDTLRLEMGYALYGHELDETIYPSETVAHWTIKWSKDFLGKPQLIELENSGNKRAEFGIILKGKGIARAGYPVYKEGQQIGKVTSGTFAPSLNQAIAIVLLERNLLEGDSVDIQIRESKVAAQIVNLPFYRKIK
jgi:aminomethyltransferase